MVETCPGIKRTVHLKEYPKFWERLRIAITQLRYQTTAAGAEQVMKEEFGIDVDIRSADKLGTVMMDEPTYTWFVMQWS
jgi:hypothetical protein